MSDLIVVEQQGATVIVQEVPAADIVEVVAAGPQGAQGVQGVKGDMGDVTPAALAAKTAAETAATSATSSAASASTSAGQAATAASTATTKASEASVSASSAASSATAAAGSATSAATSASTATTKASEAATSATSASTSASNAATSAGTATTKASEAATSATNAAASATTATTQASNAAASATAAGTAKTGAESARDSAGAAYANFVDQYLGPKSSDPTTDNTSGALAAGNLYFNTNSLASGGGMKVYDGTTWLAAYASLSGALVASNNLSDLANASTARTNLGLGNVENKSSSTIRSEITSGNVTTALGFTPYNSTNPSGYITSSALTPYLTTSVASSTYQTQAAMSSYLTTSAASSTYLPLAGGTLTGNLTFGGSNLRITGDFTSATRPFVQTSTANGNTYLGVVPNGTATNSQLQVYGTSDPLNAPFGTMTINSAVLQIQSAATGTGTVLPIRVMMSTTEAMRVSTAANVLIGTSTDDGANKLQVAGGVALTGNLSLTGASARILGDFTNATVPSRALFQTSTANSNTLVGAIPSGTATVSRFGVYNAADPANAATFSFGVSATAAEIVSTLNGTGSYLPITIFTGGSERVRVGATSGNVLIGTTTDDATNKLQVSGSVSATSFAGSGASLTGFTSGQITTALGFTPYNATNPSGYTSNVGDVTLTGTQTLTNKTLTTPTINAGYTEAVFAVTGTTPALSPTNGSIQTWTLTANSTPTAGTWASGQSMTLMIDDGTGFGVTWTTVGVVWETDLGANPTLATTGYTAVVLFKVGSTIYGARVGNA